MKLTGSLLGVGIVLLQLSSVASMKIVSQEENGRIQATKLKKLQGEASANVYKKEVIDDGSSAFRKKRAIATSPFLNHLTGEKTQKTDAKAKGIMEPQPAKSKLVQPKDLRSKVKRALLDGKGSEKRTVKLDSAQIFVLADPIVLGRATGDEKVLIGDSSSALRRKRAVAAEEIVEPQQVKSKLAADNMDPPPIKSKLSQQKRAADRWNLIEKERAFVLAEIDKEYLRKLTEEPAFVLSEIDKEYLRKLMEAQKKL